MEEKNENVVEETTQETTEKVEEVKKPNINENGDYVVNLDKPIENETTENTNDQAGVVEDVKSEDTGTAQKQEEVQQETETQEAPVLEEITEESTGEEVAEVEEKIEEAVAEAEATGKPLPENIQKLVDFMEETGGDISDYVKLNQDYNKLSDTEVLLEYYKQTKPHLSLEEISFLMEDSFSYNEDEDEEIDIKRKKLALKEQVASARSHLDGQKSKYYEEIKAGSKLTKEQQKAVDFFNRYNKESEETKKTAEAQKSNFLNKTNNVFNDKFKGFEYSVGDKKYRFNVKNTNEVKETQSDINNFVKKFLNEKNEMSDAKGYHKSLFTAMNADAIAKHFYDQGRADALKESIAKSKNVDMNPRQTHGEIEAGGIKVKVLGDTSSDFKFKIKNNK